MSEQSNISIVQDLYAALSSGDTTRVSGILGDQVSLHVSGSHHPFAHQHTGNQNVASYLSSIQTLAGDIKVAPEAVAASGDQVFAVIHVQGHRTDTPSRALDVRDVQVFTVTDGKITQVTNYAGDQQAKDDFFS
jgi:ketosteroid isomerase-like protein